MNSDSPSTNNRQVVSKSDLANAIAAYLINARPDDTPRHVIESLMLALGVNVEYVARRVDEVKHGSIRGGN